MLMLFHLNGQLFANTLDPALQPLIHFFVLATSSGCSNYNGSNRGSQVMKYLEQQSLQGGGGGWRGWMG